MKRKLPPALPPEELEKFVREESDRIALLELIALSPDRTIEERRDALAEIKGIMYRLGSMLVRSPEITGEIKAEATAAARRARQQAREPSEQRMRDAIAKHLPGGRGLAKRVARELEVSTKTVSRRLTKKNRTL
jgi:hypothetical protein